MSFPEHTCVHPRAHACPSQSTHLDPCAGTRGMCSLEPSPQAGTRDALSCAPWCKPFGKVRARTACLERLEEKGQVFFLLLGH